MITLSRQQRQKIGVYLKKKRLETGYSQKDTAAEFGLNSPQYISNIERGECAPSKDLLLGLVGLYNLPLKEVRSVVTNAYKAEIDGAFR